MNLIFVWSKYRYRFFSTSDIKDFVEDVSDLFIKVLISFLVLRWPFRIAIYFFFIFLSKSNLLNHLFDFLFFDRTRHPDVSLSIRWHKSIESP